MKQIPGGICAAKGFRAAGLRAGIKPSSPAGKNDLGLIAADVPCAAAGVFTTNVVKAAPVLLDREQRKAELARITGGSKVTEALLESAGELLDEAERYRGGI